MSGSVCSGTVDWEENIVDGEIYSYNGVNSQTMNPTGSCMPVGDNNCVAGFTFIAGSQHTLQVYAMNSAGNECASSNIITVQTGTSGVGTPTPAPTPPPSTPTPIQTPTPGPTPISVSSLTLVSGTTYNNYRITNTNGPCVVGNDVTNVTIENSNIGPCGTNDSSSDSNGIELNGGSNINIYDSYIHIQNLGSEAFGDYSSTNTHYNIYGNGATKVTIQGNVIGFASRNIIPVNASGWVINGNYIAESEDGDGGGNTIQDISGSGDTIENNYFFQCEASGVAPSGEPICPSSFPGMIDAVGDNDAVSIYGSTGDSVTGNYSIGGVEPASGDAAGIDSDSGSNSTTISNNTWLEGSGIVQNCGSVTVENNKVWSNNFESSEDVAFYFTYAGSSYCGEGQGSTSVSGNEGNMHNTDNSGETNNNGCYSTLSPNPCSSGGTFGSDFSGLTSGMTAAQVMATIPPPAIPPLPHSCVVKSPFSNNTTMPGC